MKEKYVCDLCGKTHYELDEYVKCVVGCGEKLKKLEEEEKNKKYLEELNAAINGVKQAKAYYEQKLNEFKEKYPKEYELNFASEGCNCSSDCKGYKGDAENTEDNLKDKIKSSDLNNHYEAIEIKVIDDGNGKPKIDARINGKKVDDKTLNDLSIDPETVLLANLSRFF